jgi:hypothetical protein
MPVLQGTDQWLQRAAAVMWVVRLGLPDVVVF